MAGIKMTEELKQPLMPTSQPQHLSHTPMDFSVKSESVVPEHEIRTVLRDIHKTDKTIRGHTKKVTTVAAIGNDFIVSGSKDERVKVWSLKNPQQVTTFRGHEGKVNMVAVGSHEVSHGHLAADLLDGRRLCRVEAGHIRHDLQRFQAHR